MKTDIIVRLGYYEIFTQRRTITSLLKDVEIKDSLLLLSTLNKYEYRLRKKDNAELQFIFHEWLIEDNQEIRNKIVSAYAKHANKKYKGGKLNISLKSVVLINRISTLRLLEVLCASDKEDETDKNLSLSKSRENLLKLYLLINHEIAQRQDLVFNKYLRKIEPTLMKFIYIYSLVLLNRFITIIRLIHFNLKYISFYYLKNGLEIASVIPNY